MQRPGSDSPREPLTGVTRYSPVCGVQAFAGAAEGRQQEVKCRGRQASESQTPALVAPEFCVGHHKAMVLLFRIKSSTAAILQDIQAWSGAPMTTAQVEENLSKGDQSRLPLFKQLILL